MGFAFKLDITGNMAGQLAPINRGLEAADHNLGKASVSAHRFDGAIEGVAKQSGILATLDLISLFRGVADAIGFAITKVAELGKYIIQTVAHAQDLNLAVKLQLGDAGAANLQKIADSFSNTRFDDDAIKQALLPLANAGIRDDKMLDDIATAAVDISTRFNTGQAGFEGATEALGKIATKREVDARSLMALGINEADFNKNLAQLLGTTTDNVKKQIAGGKIAAATLLSVALDEIQKKQGGALGIAALAGGKTLGATLQRLSDLPQNLFKQLEGTEALGSIQRAIDHVIDTLKGPGGTQLIASFGKALDKLFSPGNIDAFVKAIDKGISFLVGILTDDKDRIGTIMTGITFAFRLIEGITFPVRMVAGVILSVEMAIGNLGSTIGEFFSTLPARAAAFFGMTRDAFLGIGASIVEGIVAGIENGVGAIGSAIKGIGDSAVSSLREALGISSPSRVFMALGGYVGEGFAMGIEGGVGGVKAARSALVAAALPDGLAGGPSFGGGGAGGAPGGITFTVGDIIIQAHSTDPIAVGEEAELAVLRALRRVAVQLGADV
jgi:hypothetical protein